MQIFNAEGFLLFLIAVAFIILISIQLTLNKILKILQEFKRNRQ